MAASNSNLEPAKAASEWFTPGRFAAILALLTFVTYWEVVIGAGTFFHRDFAAFGYPLAYFHRESFWHGEIPLWNPLNYCGLPFLAQWNTISLYPLSLIYLLLPLSWSLGMFSLIHFFLAGMGMYYLANRWTQNSFAASVAGLAFPFSSLMLNFLMWPNHIAAMCWLPWFVLCAEQGWRNGGRWLLLAVLTGTMQMLSGAPEVILLTWLLLGVLLSFQLVTEQAAGGRARAAGRFLAMGLWVAGLAAAQLLPFLDLLRHSQRDQTFAGSEWAMPIWGWANFIVPLFRNYPTPLGGFAQPDQYCVPSYYLGVAVLLLALLGVVAGKDKRSWLLVGLTLLCLVLALGDRGMVYGAVKKAFPALGFMRYPVKFVMLPAAVVPLLAAIFISRALSLDEAGWLKLRRVIITLGGALIVACGLIIWAAYQFPFKGTEPKDALWSGLSRIVLIILFIATLWSLRQAARAKVARFALLLLLFLDVRTAGPRPNPTAERFVYDPFLATHELHLDPKPSPGDGRAMLDATAESNLSVTQMTNGVNDVLYRRFALRGNLNILDDIPKLVGMYPLYFRESGELLPLLYTAPQPPAPLMDFLSVSYTNLPGRVTQWGFRSSHLPWITAGQKPIFADGPATLAALAQPDFDPRKSVFLAPEARGGVTVSNTSSAQVFLRRFSGNRIEFEVDTAEPAMVVLAQSFYHNWRAEVNGKGVSLLRANHAFQALEVPAGHQQVVLRYQDRFFLVGTAVSLACALSWVIVWIVGARRAKNSPASTGA